MTDTVMTASEKTSKQAGVSDHILERLEALGDQFDEDCIPSSDRVYVIQDEEEACQILLAMAATIKHTADGVLNVPDKALYLGIARVYREAVVSGRALETFRKMTEEDQLSIYGMRLEARRIMLL